MGRGHGSGRGTSAKAGGFQGDASMRHMSAGLQKALTAREEEIRNGMSEKGSIFDLEGNETFRQDAGTNGAVNLKGAPWQDRVIVHNHPAVEPNGYRRADGGGSFSKNDVMDAIGLGASEMRAVTEKYTYSMKRPKSDWSYYGTWKGRQTSGAGANYDKAQAYIDKQNERYLRNYKGDKRTARRRIEAVYYHQINKNFAERMGFEYTKTKVH